MNLWLFDIDGTLVNVNQAHLDAYKKSYNEIIKRNVSDELILSTFGMSETEMHHKMFSVLHIPYEQKRVNRIIAVYSKNFLEVLEEMEVQPLPDVINCLNELQCQAVLGVVTGNIEKHAHAILKKAHLFHFFEIVSCDDGKSTRVQIVERAVAQGKKKGKIDAVIIVGDTIQDINAGKAVGAQTIAVATGSDSLQTLKAAHPDKAIISMKDYHKIY